MLERPVNMGIFTGGAFDKTVAALAPGDSHRAIVVLHLFAAIEAAPAPQVLLVLEALFGHIERLDDTAVPFIGVIFAFELVVADVVFGAAPLRHAHLAVGDGDIDGAAFFGIGQAGMAVRFTQFHVARLELGTTAKRTILDGEREIARVGRRLFQDNASG